VTNRGDHFFYRELVVEDNVLRAHYDVDGRAFVEEVTFSNAGSLDQPGVRAVAELWYLLAGLSYYKTTAARTIDLGDTPVGPAALELLRAAVLDGLGEFAYRNDLDLADVAIIGGQPVTTSRVTVDPQRVVVPFGGGIDSVVSVTNLAANLDKSLFIVSPASGNFAPLEQTATVTGLDVVRATRTLDPQVTVKDASFYNGHVPVTAMITLLAVVGAVASGRGGVVMSNEQSASVPNVTWRGRDVNHQWSKSWDAEVLLARAVAERIGDDFVVASFLRDRSENWVAREFARVPQYHHVFRSCNRAFSQRVEDRAPSWCGECDKCVFITLMLAPFVPRAELLSIMGSEPLASSEREGQLRTLVGLGEQRKPFECVGDPDECAAALVHLAASDQWRDATPLTALAALLVTHRTLDDLVEQRGPSRVPAHWLR